MVNLLKTIENNTHNNKYTGVTSRVSSSSSSSSASSYPPHPYPVWLIAIAVPADTEPNEEASTQYNSRQAATATPATAASTTADSTTTRSQYTSDKPPAAASIPAMETSTTTSEHPAIHSSWRQLSQVVDLQHYELQIYYYVAHQLHRDVARQGRRYVVSSPMGARLSEPPELIRPERGHRGVEVALHHLSRMLLEPDLILILIINTFIVLIIITSTVCCMCVWLCSDSLGDRHASSIDQLRLARIAQRFFSFSWFKTREPSSHSPIRSGKTTTRRCADGLRVRDACCLEQGRSRIQTF